MRRLYKKNSRKDFSRREMETHTIAISNPPPKARPSMAATEGFFEAENNQAIK
jgi:hypothetical protein